MWSSRLFWRLFIVYVGLNLTLAITFLLIVRSYHRTEISRQISQRLKHSATLLRDHAFEIASHEPNSTPTRQQLTAAAPKLQSLVDRLSGQTELRFTIKDDEGTVLADSGGQIDAASAADSANDDWQQTSDAGAGGTLLTNSLTNEEMFSLGISADLKGDGEVFVRVAQPMTTIRQHDSLINRFLWTFALFFGIVASGLTYAIVSRIIHPLAQLTLRAEAIARGDDHQPLVVRSQDEVGVLAGAFNQMQSELAARFQQLRENNEQMTTVLSSMDEGIIAIDSDERIVLANDASKSLLDFRESAEMGRSMFEVVRSRPLHEVVSKCLESGRSLQTEFEAAGSSRKHLSVRATCLPGVPTPGIVVVLHDITELRRLENLRQEFVANVSHELKTPLASIKAYAETLRLGALDDAENNLRFISRIEKQADRLHQLILDMLQIARIESGQEAFDFTEVSVGEAIDACVAQYTASADRKQIELIVQRPPEPSSADLTMWADRDGIRAILDNLISNAIKYTPEGGDVFVRWRSDGENAVMEVQDTGIGIAPKFQSRVFERFFRVDQARSREMGGTGLGLSIVKHLSQSFGGSVILQSQVGEGCTFRVTLPLSPPDVAVSTASNV